MKKLVWIIIMLSLGTISKIPAQKVGVNTNLLYSALGTVNFGIETTVKESYSIMVTGY